MSQISPTAVPRAQKPPAPPPPAPPASTTGSAESAQTKAKIAAIYAEAAAEHKPAAVVQQEVNAVIATSPPQYTSTATAVTSANEDQINLFDASA